ncbi:MAG: hypothetical protein ACM3ML_31805 [Micromonosporaceae bacterium]
MSTMRRSTAVKAAGSRSVATASITMTTSQVIRNSFFWLSQRPAQAGIAEP